MQLFPWLGFYYRQHDRLDKLTTGADNTKLLDFASALVPVIKKYYPAINDNGLLDDALGTLRASTAPAPKYDPPPPVAA